MILRFLTRMASPTGGGAQLAVFCFHRIPQETDPLQPEEPSAEVFNQILKWIGAQFRVLDPYEACERLTTGNLPSNAAIISFDDGYLNNFEVALPLLIEHRMQAVFFIATSFLEGDAMFNDRVIEAVRRADRPIHLSWPEMREAAVLPVDSIQARRQAVAAILPVVKYLSAEQREERVRELESHTGCQSTPNPMMRAEHVRMLHRAGMRIGGHTRSHPILRLLTDQDAIWEISGGMADIEQITGEKPQLFAYPNGRPGDDYDYRHVEIVKEAGFRAAFSTKPGAANRHSEIYELPRFTPWDRTRIRFGLRALYNVAGSSRLLKYLPLLR